MITKLTLLCAGLLVVAACKTGSSYRPIVSNPGANYENDLLQCQEFSKQRAYFNGDTGAQAATSAGLGGIAGAFLGGDLQSAVAGAAIGGALGAGSGMMEAKDDKKYIINRCLKEKGYNVYM